MKPQSSITHVDIEFGKLKEGQKFLILSRNFMRTCGTVKIEMGLNVMTNDSKVMSAKDFVNILCELLKVLRSDDDTACSKKTLKELIVNCFSKDPTKYLNCTNEVKIIK